MIINKNQKIKKYYLMKYNNLIKIMIQTNIKKIKKKMIKLIDKFKLNNNRFFKILFKMTVLNKIKK